MFKKYMAAILACALTLALSIPVIAGASSGGGGVANPSSIWASSSTSTGNITLTYEAMMKIPVLLVKVTNNGALILNPYRLQYDAQADTNFSSTASFNFGEIGSSAGSSAHVATSSDTSNPLDGKQMTFRQIISSPLIIESKTVVPIKVGVYVESWVGQRGSLAKDRLVMAATRPITGIAKPDMTKKTVCMWVAAGTSAATVSDNTRTPGTAAKATQNARLVNPFSDYWTKGEGKTKDKPYLILTETKVAGKGVENKAIMQIPAAKYENTSQHETSTITSGASSFGVLMFDGEMIPMPTDLGWNTDDVITPKVTINLQVMPNPINSSEVMHNPWHTNYEG